MKAIAQTLPAQRDLPEGRHQGFFQLAIHSAEDVVCIFQKRLGWPHDTMMRNSIYYQNKEILADQDYLFAIDADMLFNRSNHQKRSKHG